MEQNNQTTAAGASVDDAAQAGLLDDLMARTAPCFARRETRLTCRDMVNGMLAELDDHNCWTIAEAAGHPGPHRMQHLLSRARVDDQRMLNTAADWAAGHLCAGQDPGDVVLIVDETGDAKTSADCAGAARQYSGTLGGIAMCQVAVTLTCAAPAGHAMIGRALYLPAGWAADEERRELAGVPDDVVFATKPQLADGLLQHACDRGIRAAFIAGDEVYGGLDLRTSIRQRGTGYVMAVRSNHAVTLPSGRRLTVKNAASLMKPGRVRLFWSDCVSEASVPYGPEVRRQGRRKGSLRWKSMCWESWRPVLSGRCRGWGRWRACWPGWRAGWPGRAGRG